MTLVKSTSSLVLFALVSISCGNPSSTGPEDAQRFLDEYSARYQKLDYAESLARWDLNTHIVDGDTVAAAKASAAGKARAAYTGSTEVIDRVRALLANPDGLTPLQIRQLNVILYRAGDNPQTVSDLVDEKIKLDNELVGILFGFRFSDRREVGFEHERDRSHSPRGERSESPSRRMEREQGGRERAEGWPRARP